MLGLQCTIDNKYSTSQRENAQMGACCNDGKAAWPGDATVIKPLLWEGKSYSSSEPVSRSSGASQSSFMQRSCGGSNRRQLLDRRERSNWRSGRIGGSGLIEEGGRISTAV